jgi:signal transduction histidine kinase
MNQPTRLLVVDDSPEYREVMSRLLRPRGYEVVCAGTGRAGLRLARRWQPNLVLLDVVLPDLSGYDVCRTIKADPALVDVFVVLISGQDTATENKVAGLGAGADEYLAKPIPPAELVARVNALVRIQRSEEQIRQLNQTLERRVTERTADLKSANQELACEIAGHRRAEATSAAFAKLGQRLNSARSGKEAARIIVRVADQLLGWDAAFLDTYSAARDQVRTTLNLDTVRHRRIELPPASLEGPPTPMQRLVMRSGGKLVLRKPGAGIAGQWRRFGNKRRRSASLMFVPIRSGHSVVGVLSIQSYRANAYDAVALRTLQALADHAGGALERIDAEEIVRRLPQRILDAQEAERRRVSRELHDGVNQLLASIRFRVHAVGELLTGVSPRAQKEAARAADLLERAQREVRAIARNLRPSELDDLGLVPAVRAACAEFKRRTGLAIQLRPPARPLPLHADLTLYRILQEALNNVERHACARRVNVRLGRRNGFAELVVRDDGRGFARKRDSTPGEGGSGLVNMRERAALAGGTVRIHSSRRDGTEIVVRVPLHPANGS